MLEFQKLGGLLGHASICIEGAPPFLDEIWLGVRFLWSRANSEVLHVGKRASAYKCSWSFWRALMWFAERLAEGPCLYVTDTFYSPSYNKFFSLKDIVIQTDASSDGCGGVVLSGRFEGAYFRHTYDHRLKGVHINLCELLTCVSLILAIGNPFQDSFMCELDNKAAIGIMRKGRSRNMAATFWMKSVLYNWCIQPFRYKCTYVKSDDMTEADPLSRPHTYPDITQKVHEGALASL